MKKYIIVIVAFLLILAIWNNDLQSKRQIEKDKVNLQTREFEQKVRIKQDEDYEKGVKERYLEECLINADGDYWGYVELNGTKKEDGTIWALNDVWDRAAKNKQTAKDNCYKQYK